jgi:2-polyprenyl-3-methyl-5-hydroxy-6-metoxy-1,4-benzoquinol methylase
MAAPVRADPNVDRAAAPAGAAPRELRPFYRALYRDAALPQRLLATWRPSICPLAPLVAFVPAGARTLDIGCGSGALLLLLAAAGRIGNGVGCDISGTAIGAAIAARRRLSGPAVDFRQIADLADVPDGQFDAVLMIDVLRHIPPARQREAVLAAARRVARGGVLIYKDMASRPAWRRIANTLHDLLLAQQIVSYVPVAEVERWLTDFGLSLVHGADYARLVYGHELRVFRRAA